MKVEIILKLVDDISQLNDSDIGFDACKTLKRVISNIVNHPQLAHSSARPEIPVKKKKDKAQMEKGHNGEPQLLQYPAWPGGLGAQRADAADA